MNTPSIVDWVTNNLPAMLCALIVVAGIDAVGVALRCRRRTSSGPRSGLTRFVVIILNVVMVMGLATIVIGIRGLSMIYLTGR